MKNQILKIVVLVLFSTCWLFAGQTGKIAGSITDASSGERLAGVNIIVEGMLLGAASDQEGDFIILNLKPGIYTLSAMMVGYQTMKVQNIAVSIDRTTRVNFALPSAVLETDVIVVEADQMLIQKDLTASASTVSAREIEAIPVESMQDILQLQAGIVADEGGGFHLRGGRSNEIAYMVDGVSVSDPYNGQIAVNVDQDAIQELKVISGTFNAEYGKVMSGIVEVVTKDPGDEFHFGVTSYVGDYVSSRTKLYDNIDQINPANIYNVQFNVSGRLPAISNKLGYYASVRKSYTDGWMYGDRRYKTSDSSYTVLNTFYAESSGDGKAVPMNNSDKYFGNFKLTYKIFPGLKLSYNLLANKTDQRFYNHLYRFNPDGDTKNHEFGFTNILSLDHTLSSTTFYTLKFSHYSFDLKSYLYEDLDDPRYQNPDLLRVREDAYSFYTGGTNANHYYRTSTVNLGKFDITSQVTKTHQLKAGLEFKSNIIREEVDEARYNGKESDVFNAYLFINQGEFKHRPIEISAYIQDKIELENLTVNAGLRYDLFDSKGKVPTDLRDPGNTYNPVEKAYKDADVQHQFSPRLGLAFPVSASGVIHASYGHFFQVPDYRFVYDNPRFAVVGGLNTLMGNSNLKPQSTVIYEIGFQQEFAGIYGLHVTGFYKDARDLLGTTVYETYVLGDRYARYENRDYGNIKGITLSVKKHPSRGDYISLSLDYTFQVAEGNASDPNHVFNNSRSDPPKQSNIQVVALDWDQTHTVNVAVSYDNPKLLNIGLIGQYQSGLPYTPEILSVESTFENSGRKPTNYNLDMRLSKDFRVWGGSLTLFLKMYNLFDRGNEVRVYNDTGRAGYSMINKKAGNRQAVVNTLDEWIKRPDYYSEPRKILIGFTLGL